MVPVVDSADWVKRKKKAGMVRAGRLGQRHRNRGKETGPAQRRGAWRMGKQTWQSLPKPERMHNGHLPLPHPMPTWVNGFVTLLKWSSFLRTSNAHRWWAVALTIREWTLFGGNHGRVGIPCLQRSSIWTLLKVFYICFHLQPRAA